MKSATIFCLLILTIGLSSCAGRSRLPAVPVEQTLSASVLGIEHVRFWPTLNDDSITHIIMEAIEKSANPGLRYSCQYVSPSLSLSSGGDRGAFGAGLLVGWSAAGNRPEFSFVTGTSTGALIAPFAFLGPDYDDILKTLYTNTSTKDIYRLNVLDSLSSDSTADSRPLFKLIENYVDDALLMRIAAEYSKGRLLFIGTTNLDARLPVVWNMGAIAASKHPGALELFRQILHASASVPSLFPPVLIESNIEETVYHEMHVDGGMTEQVFAYPDWLTPECFDEKHRKLLEARRPVIYIVRNSRAKPEWSQVDRNAIAIGYSAIQTMTHALGDSDIHRIFFQTVRDNIDFNLAAIGPDFLEKNPRGFNIEYMRRLFEYGYNKALEGYPWKKFPSEYAIRRLPHSTSPQN